MSRSLPALTALVLAAGLLGGPSFADTNSVKDTTEYDVPAPAIDMTKLRVTYSGKGASAKLFFKDLKRTKRVRIFVAFTTEPDDSGVAPIYGNFIEFRLKPNGKKRVVNWVIDPSYGDYDAQKCQGVKVTPNYNRDVLTYVLPKRCVHFDLKRGHVDSYASARKFKAKHWDSGSPAETTGDWFDTTPGVRTKR